ncbi:hypothetical protein Taro_021948 [Colocasia esculenta]|uniref:glycerophosphodiester phosphodiesterase n=1 Tax=Colocasia esculenta TaxID=4460 RepID=A0A843V6X4_COLES|nr:hypothetical protein [Colocasia esculenta]
MEPTTKQSYSAFLNDLSIIKSFCSGILVPKDYIWHVDDSLYLKPPTSLVQDAHKQGLEVYAYNFANDIPGSYNYSYDPTMEYLQFIDNPDFAVDGVLTDFPSTASEAVACLAHNKKGATMPKDKPLIITHNGASGDFASCTDLAYQKAVENGADVIDCSVQMTKDGIAICLDSADLMSSTTAVTTFMSQSAMIPEIQPNNGVFSFDLTWSEIQTLKPDLQSPLKQANLPRNPAMKNQGKFISLAEFLEFANDKAVSGILINIENAAYLASKGLDVISAVTTALTNSSFSKQATEKVFIQSNDSAVLSRFKEDSPYRRILLIKEIISDAPQPTVDEIKQIADAVNLPRSSIFSNSGGFLVTITDVVDKLQTANISVYVSTLRNEFMALAFDFFADPMLEVANYVSQVGVDGVVTEYPATAAAYMRSPCYNFTKRGRYTVLPIEPGSLMQMAAPGAAPPVEAPAPSLTVADVRDPPLPPVTSENASSLIASPPSAHSSGQPSNVMINASLLLLMAFISMAFLS